jgi:N utilization substance protein B
MSAAPQPKSGPRSRAPGTARHSAAREAALQALYQMEITGAPAAVVVDEFVTHRLGATDEEATGGRKANAKMFAALVGGVSERREALDEALRPLLAAGWQIERLEIIMRCILRLGAFELMTRLEVPARVVVSEYVTLAGAFFNGDEPGAVNGILDRLARSLRPGELEARGDGARRSQRPAG